MKLFAFWFCRGCGLMLCCAAIVCGAGCHSTDNSANASGVSKNKNGAFSPFNQQSQTQSQSQPQKPATVSDWMNQPRPN